MTTQKNAGILSLGGKRLSYALTLMLTLAAMLLPSSAKADEAWAEYDSGTKALTFKYGAEKPSGSGTVTVYDLNGDYESPGWNSHTCTKVVFDESFSKARPITCYEWFSGQSSLTSIEGMEYLNTEEVTSMTKMFYGCSALKSIDLSHFNTANVTSMSNMFTACGALESLDLSSFNTDNVSEMTAMFSRCRALKSLDVSSFNTSSVTDMWYMFCHCQGLTELNVLNFNTAKVEDMSNMFEGCTGLTTLDLSNFNTANVTCMDSMFCKSTGLKTIYVSNKFVTTNVESSEVMFLDCTSLAGANKIYEEKSTDADMANYTDGYFTYKEYSLKEAWAEYDSDTETLTFKYGADKPESSDDVTVYELNIGYSSPQWNVDDYTSVVFDKSFSEARPTTCYEWFDSQNNLASIKGLEYLNTEKASNMRSMFYGCSSLESIDLSNFNTANVTDMMYMFSYCSALTELDLSSFNTANVTNMDQMFSDCSDLTTIYVKQFDVNENAETTNMFEGCTSLAGAKEYDEDSTDGTMANYTDGYFTYKGEAWAEYNSSTGTLTFKYGAAKPSGDETVTVYELNEAGDVPGWNSNDYTSVVFDESFSKARPATCNDWFSRQDKLASIKGLGYLNTASVTSMGYMFYGCSALKSLDVSKFNTEKVTSMSHMFEACSALEDLDVSCFNTANVESMDYMFCNCTALKTLDLPNFDTKSVLLMGSMFSGCSALTAIYVSDNFDAANVSSSDGMFSGCTVLEGAAKYNKDKTDAAMANYTNGYFKKYTADEAWAQYDSDTQTLTFKYGKDKPETGGTLAVYELNKAYTSPEWQDDDCTSVVFDESFSKARPTTCYEWFDSQNNLASIKGLEYLNTEEVTDMNSMFYDCTSLESLDLSGFNTAKVTDMMYMFSSCANLKTIYVSDKFDTAKVVDSDNMFTDCASLVGAKGFNGDNTDVSMANYTDGYFTYKGKMWAEYDSTTGTLTFKSGDDLPENSDAVTVYQLKEDGSNPAWHANTYTTVVFDPSFSKARPTTCSDWFSQQDELASIKGLENLNTEDVTDMGYMFFGCAALKSLDVSTFNTEKVTSMTHMFEACYALENLDLSSFNTANVTTMDYMFYNCTALQTLDLSSFDTKKSLVMSNLFNGCTALTTIYASDKFELDETASTTDMFTNCTSLVGAAKYSDSSTGGSMANYKTGYFKTYYKVGDTKHDLCGETLRVDNLELEGDKDLVVLAPFTAASATYSRTTSSKWGTLCVPFEVDAANNTGTKFYKLESVSTDVITLTQLSGTIAAGTPMLVNSTGDNGSAANISISAKNVSVKAAPANGDKTSGWQLVGSFAETEVPDNGYIISKNKFWLVSDLKANITGAKSVKTKAMRAWLKPGADNGAKSHVLSIALDDENETTAVDAIEALTEDTAEIYDLQGRCLNSLQKGLNIVKTGNVTRKVMVK